jgi:hypothetical protein
MKYFLLLMLAFMLACSSAPKSPNGSGPQPEPEPIPELPLGYDPSYQLEYVSLDEMGLPRGQCVNVGVQNSWRASAAHESMRECLPSEVAGTACSNLGSFCKINNISALSCRAETTHRCHGWVYEETKKESGPSDFKPLKDADAFIFYFVGCMVGICNPQSEVVKTDENGYFMFHTTTMKDSLRIKKDGYFGACNVDRPFPFAGGSFPNNVAEPVIPPQKMQVLKPDSCQ